MVKMLVLVACLGGVAAADPVATWISNDEVFAWGGPWWSWGAGLALRRDLGPAEVGLEGQALRIDASDDDDPRHGFALRAAVALDVAVARSAWRQIDWRLAPQLGIAGELRSGLGEMAHGTTEVFAGVRASFRKVVSPDATHDARGIGGHLTIRIGRSEGAITGGFMIGYDWGL